MSNSVDATILIDGVKEQKNTPVVMKLTIGNHRISLEKNGEIFEADVKVIENETVEVYGKLFSKENRTISKSEDPVSRLVKPPLWLGIPMLYNHDSFQNVPNRSVNYGVNAEYRHTRFLGVAASYLYGKGEIEYKNANIDFINHKLMLNALLDLNKSENFYLAPGLIWSRTSLEVTYKARRDVTRKLPVKDQYGFSVYLGYKFFRHSPGNTVTQLSGLAPKRYAVDIIPIGINYFFINPSNVRGKPSPFAGVKLLMGF